MLCTIEPTDPSRLVTERLPLVRLLADASVSLAMEIA